jgi:RNA recognition motif-containing protein
MKLYVGNLPNTITEVELQEVFAPFGEIKSVNIIKDKFTGEPRGFGFVEMAEKDAATAAITELDGKEIKGRKVRVSEAQPRPERTGGGRGGFGGNRSGGSSGGFGGRSGGGDRGGFGGDRGGFGGSDRGPRRNSW